MSAMSIPLIILGFLAAAVALAALIFLFTALFGLTWKILRNIFRFVGAEVGDALRLIGSLLTAVFFAPLVVLNIVLGRWSASRHFSDAFASEMGAAGRAGYRLVLGNPARLLGLGQALEGVEQRVPRAMAASPGRDLPAKRVGQFDGYTILGSLQGGGSGSKLYIAEPDQIKRAGFNRQGVGDVDRVVIKVFSLKDGSSLPQIVRESRALDAAKKLGLVLEHELTPERFFYVMRYVPGDSLSVVTQRLHAASAADGLDNKRLGTALGYAGDLVASLAAYHKAGLWHKDVKPDNIIVDGQDGRAHLVDFGLVTPLRSAMTLTTHGTEYFRDPELVRQALRGVKVHQIDGSKFDVYAAGAVVFSVIENSFPAHGGLSQITKRCPDALRWIVRRAMTDYDRRYASAAEMLADLRTLQNAADPFKLKPVDLPSVSGQATPFVPEPIPAPFSASDAFEPAAATVDARRSPEPHRPDAEARTPGERPRLSVSDWWSGRYSVVAASNAPRAEQRPAPAARVHRPLTPSGDRKPASEQVRDARARARQRRRAANERIAQRRTARPSYNNGPSAPVIFAGLLGLGVIFAMGIVGVSLFRASEMPPRVAESVAVDAPALPPAPPAPRGEPRPELPEVTARLLVVSDLGLPLSPELKEQSERVLGVLRERGAVLSGDLLGDQPEQVLDTIATLRRDRGGLPIDSTELNTRVREWLDTRDTEGVLLVATNPEQPGEAMGVLVTKRSFTRVPWDNAGPTIVRVLADVGFKAD